MSSSKNPENEAENPAPMPRTQQGQGGVSHDSDPAGQQGASVRKAKMAPQPSAPPGLEQDALGNAIPFEQRTEEDQELARGGAAGKSGKR
jgi:hypothetical protein